MQGLGMRLVDPLEEDIPGIISTVLRIMHNTVPDIESGSYYILAFNLHALSN